MRRLEIPETRLSRDGKLVSLSRLVSSFSKFPSCVSSRLGFSEILVSRLVSDLDIGNPKKKDLEKNVLDESDERTAGKHREPRSLWIPTPPERPETSDCL